MRNITTYSLAFYLALLVFLVGNSAFAFNIGQKVPKFSLRDCQGTIHYSTDYCGSTAKEPKLLIVGFFATYCKPCKESLPILEQIHDRYSKKGLEVVLISFQETEKNLREYAKKNGVQFPILMDKYGEVAKNFGVFGLPRTFMLGTDCTLKKQIIGEQKDLEQVLTSEMEKLLGGKAEEKK